MMRKISWIVCLAIVTFAATAFAGISVDHDKSADFSKYETFTLVEATEASHPLMRARLLGALEVAFGAAGLEKVDEGANLHVFVHTSSDTETRITTDTLGYGGYRGWRGWGGWGATTVDVDKIAVGTLMLDMVDAGTEQLVWRGIATDSLPSKAEKLEKKIYKAVDKLFRHFPPDD
jgi:hypothetical protein